ncbi:pseudaminic acid synthase [bacterium]|nr:pseudaminic acid synthase [Akkermansiaceae bacterium]MDA8980729.1 pseudaminic acid synthase [bacterium]MDB4508614.1 pseudaminic acid synthase [Akkermansiaceae bacterium]MDB4577238.1 pseudaminic acid synthase [bacterium]
MSQNSEIKKAACYIIAEISANHNGSLGTALEMVKIAKEAGADAVKIQTYTADTLTLDSDQDYFKIGGGTLWDGQTLYQLYQEAHTPWDWHEAIFKEARNLGIDCFSTPFDETAVDFLEQFDPPFYKIASFELVHHPLLKKVAQTGRPVIMSTGMATLDEIALAVEVLRSNGCQNLTLLKCTSSYPAPAAEANLARIPHMAQTFGCRAGLSDHTLGVAVPIAAVAIGAEVIEKHFCRSRSEPGPDSAFSLEPQEFREMVDAVRIAELAIGEVTYQRTEKEQNSLMFRRSLFFTQDLPVGHVVTFEDVKVVRPGHGLKPEYLDCIIGTTLSTTVSAGTPVDWNTLK